LASQNLSISATKNRINEIGNLRHYAEGAVGGAAILVSGTGAVEGVGDENRL